MHGKARVAWGGSGNSIWAIAMVEHGAVCGDDGNRINHAEEATFAIKLARFLFHNFLISHTSTCKCKMLLHVYLLQRDIYTIKYISFFSFLL